MTIALTVTLRSVDLRLDLAGLASAGGKAPSVEAL
jgi:hypothetical protein